MDNITEPSAVEDRLQEQLQARMGVARALADAAYLVATKRSELGQAEETYRETFNAARNAGWTDTELKRAGLSAPPARARARSKRNPTPPAAPDA